jgi:hypothetical protein
MIVQEIMQSLTTDLIPCVERNAEAAGHFTAHLKTQNLSSFCKLLKNQMHHIFHCV